MTTRSRFANPPADRRMLQMFHRMPETAEERRRVYEQIKAAGFGGLVTNVSFDEYLESEEHWQEFLDGVEEARERGFWLWLYDEEGYPSGLAGGLTLRDHPEYQAEGVGYYHVDGNGELSLTVPEGVPIYACLCPLEEGEPVLPGESVEIGDSAEVVTQTPAGEHRLMVFSRQYLYEGTHAAANVHQHRPYINMLDDRAVNRFVELTYDAYEKRVSEGLDETLGDLFAAVFTDEPSLQGGYLVDGGQTAPVIPWSYDLEEWYRKSYHEELLPLLPYLFEGQGEEQTRVRCWFYNLVSELLAERYGGTLQDWCQKRGLASSGHLLLEESLVAHVYYYGDYMRSARRQDWPGIDVLSSRCVGAKVRESATPLGMLEPIPLHAKLLGSVAELVDAPRVMSETSDHVQRVRGQDPVTEEEILGTIGWQYVLGVNTLTSYYRQSWQTDDDEAPAHDWPAINTYVGRLGEMLVGSRWAGEIAVYYPIATAWASFIPQRATVYERAEPAECLAVDDMFREVGKQLVLSNLDYTLLDSPAFATGPREPEWWRRDPASIKYLVLPMARVIPRRVMMAIYQFWRLGGKVLAVGAPPEIEAETGQPGIVAQMGSLMFAEPDKVRTLPNGGRSVLVSDVATLTRALHGWGASEVKLLTEGATIVHTIRRGDGRTFVMLFNYGEARQRFVVKVPMSRVEIWDPVTADVAPWPQEAGEFIALDLEPYRALFLREA
ncbi:MAG: hypothetical protein ACP5G7_03625 [Anaerolineae bacterium]